MHNLDKKTLRIVFVADVALGWLLLLVSLGVWFGLGAVRPALITAGLGAALGLIGRLVATMLISNLPGTLDLNTDSAFERYFAEQERKEAQAQQNMGLLMAGLAVVAVVFVVGNAMVTREVPGAEFSVYAMWCAAVFALVLYTLHLDDIFAALPDERTAPLRPDREEETPPWW